MEEDVVARFEPQSKSAVSLRNYVFEHGRRKLIVRKVGFERLFDLVQMLRDVGRNGTGLFRLLVLIRGVEHAAVLEVDVYKRQLV